MGIVQVVQLVDRRNFYATRRHKLKSRWIFTCIKKSDKEVLRTSVIKCDHVWALAYCINYTLCPYSSLLVPNYIELSGKFKGNLAFIPRCCVQVLFKVVFGVLLFTLSLFHPSFTAVYVLCCLAVAPLLLLSWQCKREWTALNGPHSLNRGWTKKKSHYNLKLHTREENVQEVSMKLLDLQSKAWLTFDFCTSFTFSTPPPTIHLCYHLTGSKHQQH